MDSTPYWLWLARSLGAGSNKVAAVTEQFNSPMQLYDEGFSGWKSTRIFSDSELERMNNISLDSMRRMIEEHQNRGIYILTPESEGYPDKLKEIYDLPAVLFVKGKMPDIDSCLSIGIVGTRRATDSGLRLAHNFGKRLSQKNIVVVSGGAMGIDTEAHRGALSAEGITLCVLGCGISYNYMPSTKQMRDDITVNGAVISEYPMDTPPSKFTFPTRNRIISGLSDGVLVVQAGYGSGSLITARCALEQDRDIFAVPGGAYDKTFDGTNALIKDGAKITTRIRDIVEEYGAKYPYLAGSAPRKKVWHSTRVIQPKTRRDDYFEKLERAVEKAKQTGNWSISIDDLPSEKEIATLGKTTTEPKMVLEYLPIREFETSKIEINDNKPGRKSYDRPTIKDTPKPVETAAVKREITLPDDISNDARAVFEVLTDEPLHISEIGQTTNLTPQEILSAVTDLELEDAIIVLPGNRYKKP